MNKTKRKLYKIKQMRRDGLTYQERGEMINGINLLVAKRKPEVSGRCLRHDELLHDGICELCYKETTQEVVTRPRVNWFVKIWRIIKEFLNNRKIQEL